MMSRIYFLYSFAHKLRPHLRRFINKSCESSGHFWTKFVLNVVICICTSPQPCLIYPFLSDCLV